MKGLYIEIRDKGYFYKSMSTSKIKSRIIEMASLIMKHHNRESHFSEFMNNEFAIFQFAHDIQVANVEKSLLPSGEYLYHIRTKDM